MHDELPRRTERLVKWSLAPWERAAVLGDMQEEFHYLSHASGHRLARRWYWRQSALSVWPNLLRRLRGDDRRLQLISLGAAMIECGLLKALQVWLSPSGHPWTDGGVLILSGILIIVSGVFRKRVQMPTLQISVARVAVGMMILAIVVGPFFSSSWADVAYRRAMWLCPAALLFAISLWPWRPLDAAPPELSVRGKAGPHQDPEAWLTVSVPNAPLGLSGLVLCRAPASAPVAGSDRAVRAVRADEPTIDRRFSRAEAVRVCALLNVTDRPANATVDLVDSNGQVVTSSAVPVTVGPFEQIVKSWDDIADDDPAEHFGQIDVTLPLVDAAPGRYRLRVTAVDGAHSSQRDESIVVTF